MQYDLWEINKKELYKSVMESGVDMEPIEITI
jgi:hypothetical protein